MELWISKIDRNTAPLEACRVFVPEHRYSHPARMRLLKMVTFMDKTTRGRRYLHVQSSENDIDEVDTKLLIRSSATSLCKSDGVGSPSSLPWWSKKKKTGEIFLPSSDFIAKANLSSHQLLCHNIEFGHKLWIRLPLHGEFSCKSLYWEWLEDILACCKDKLTTLHLFDALYASLFLSDRCSDLIRAGCEYRCPETNTRYASKGEVSLSIFDIHSSLELSLSGRLCDTMKLFLPNWNSQINFPQVHLSIHCLPQTYARY
ncbi:hypothetical protein Cgig2_005796 [Carnegiea gigantea]|uniref:Uncharacterized protein n=1 Tax=Carnegiea gigantea TaxID=171969 RepID=A0A9Q1KJJ3_9CARY|nr:hypothetical protein Cgig2_005796 [Carnegiea gigantea]